MLSLRGRMLHASSVAVVVLTDMSSVCERERESVVVIDISRVNWSRMCACVCVCVRPICLELTTHTLFSSLEGLGLI